MHMHFVPRTAKRKLQMSLTMAPVTKSKNMETGVGWDGKKKEETG